MAVRSYHGQQFYFVEDDMELNVTGVLLFEVERQPVAPQKLTSQQHGAKFTFTDHTLAYTVRERMYTLLVQYDANNDHLFDRA